MQVSGINEQGGHILVDQLPVTLVILDRYMREFNHVSAK